MKHLFRYIIFVVISTVLLSCSHSKEVTSNYYQQHGEMIRSLKKRYLQLNKEQAFAVEFRDKEFNRIALEIITDSIRYIYNFRLDQHLLRDTLIKYHFDPVAMVSFLDDMKKINCTWVSTLDYYENKQQKFLTFVAARDKKLGAFSKKEKYFTLAIFDEPQQFDDKGRLLDGDNVKNLRPINDETYHKINSRVFYAITGKFR